MALHLYLDECISVKFEGFVRQFDRQRRYIDHIEHASWNGRGFSDSAHLRIAAKQQHILITFNIGDFIWLNRLWKTLHSWQLLQSPHGGILATPATLSVDAVAAEVYNFCSQHPLPVLENNMYILKGGVWTAQP